MNYELICGDALTVLRTLPGGSVQMCCTSPPYFGLRDYGTATWEGGDLNCDHKPSSTPAQRGIASSTLTGGQATNGHKREGYKGECSRCGARRIDNQIGLEETPEAYVAKLVEVFREVRRVLHPSGTCWINIGDSYNGSGGAGGDYSDGGLKAGQPKYPGRNVNGLGPKQLLGIPWRLAFGLQADGWILRSEIIWHKLAPMPESVTDRCTKAHEQVFLLAKSRDYFFDAEAIKESGSGRAAQNRSYKYDGLVGHETKHGFLSVADVEWHSRNKRSVWTLGPEQFHGAHFAVMPTKLAEPCILAGTSAKGCCSKCLSPYERMVERTKYEPEEVPVGVRNVDASRGDKTRRPSGKGYNESVRTLGETWQPTCTCFGHFELVEWPREYDEDGDETVASQIRPPRRVFVPDGEVPEPVPAVVLDPFFGSGTTGAVALKHGRRFVGIDLDPRNVELAHDRIARMQPMLFEVTA